MICWTEVPLLSESSMYTDMDETRHATARDSTTVNWVNTFTQAVVTTLLIDLTWCAVWDIVPHFNFVPINICVISFWWTKGCGENSFQSSIGENNKKLKNQNQYLKEILKKNLVWQ